ncbi:hypothetical protein EV714DRAFT_246117, partial [Schizophyllum commune]
TCLSLPSLFLHSTCSPHVRSEDISSSHPPPNSRPSKNSTAVCTETAQGTAALQKYATSAGSIPSRVLFPRLKAHALGPPSRQLYSRFLRPKTRPGSPCPHFGQRVRDRISQCHDVVNNGEPAAHQDAAARFRTLFWLPHSRTYFLASTLLRLREGYSCGTSTVPCPPANAAHSWPTQTNP